MKTSISARSRRRPSAARAPPQRRGAPRAASSALVHRRPLPDLLRGVCTADPGRRHGAPAAAHRLAGHVRAFADRRWVSSTSRPRDRRRPASASPGGHRHRGDDGEAQRVTECRRWSTRRGDPARDPVADGHQQRDGARRPSFAELAEALYDGCRRGLVAQTRASTTVPEGGISPAPATTGGRHAVHRAAVPAPVPGPAARIRSDAIVDASGGRRHATRARRARVLWRLIQRLRQRTARPSWPPRSTACWRGEHAAGAGPGELEAIRTAGRLSVQPRQRAADLHWQERRSQGARAGSLRQRHASGADLRLVAGVQAHRVGADGRRDRRLLREASW